MIDASTRNNQATATPHKALMTIRLIWAALLAGQIMFMVVIAVLQSINASPQADPQVAQVLFLVALAMLTTMIPVGYFIRNQVYKKNWQEDVVTPGGYVSGNILLLALCEGVALVGLVAVLIGGVIWYAVPSLVAMAVQVINFPHGRPMWPDRLANARKLP